ncbi:hypothetical protein OWR29_26000 [Actinoplanes sp. Pm04-4]|uniref:Uncharacterized protein n=1 Tax=Paractinoplanes pyxinae TaxID=2997416 RepID=A0ABT4B4Q3_9ACTN|nr:hypothetical protein [Actinoplanes pyxinae]MCY1141464.1 hypothetical protein [Actinoplanes pyxinae]
MTVRLIGRALLALLMVPALSTILCSSDKDSHIAAMLPASSSSVVVSVEGAMIGSSGSGGHSGRLYKIQPPGWIWRIFNGGVESPGGDCSPGRPTGGVVPDVVTRRFEQLSICFRGVAKPDRPAKLRITTPDGRQVQAAGDQFGPRKDRKWNFEWFAEDAVEAFPRPGAYRFAFTTSKNTTTGRIVVKPSTERRAKLSGRTTARAGTTMMVTAFGRQPGSQIAASLYRESGTDGPKNSDMRSRHQLVRSLPAVVAGRAGEAVLRWTVTKQDLPGNYVVRIDPTAGSECDFYSCDSFEVVR